MILFNKEVYVAISALIVGLISLVISVISLLAMAIVVQSSINSNNTQSHNPTQTHTSNDHPEYDRGFSVGSTGVWNCVQLAVFDMFRSADIFDYEGTMENLTEKINIIMKDDEFRTKLHSDLDDYMKRGERGDNGY
jgi:hypothetical protein